MKYRCQICKRKLTKLTSQVIGIGSICIKKYQNNQLEIFEKEIKNENEKLEHTN